MSRWLAVEEFELFEPVARSLRIEGFSTSVRLERIFWEMLDQMAAERGLTTCALVAEIHREVSVSAKPLTNFSSALRVICLRQMELHGAPDEPKGGRENGDGSLHHWSGLSW
jgi:predicted DNA-binding ribbon-helix-helix protein